MRAPILSVPSDIENQTPPKASRCCSTFFTAQGAKTALSATVIVATSSLIMGAIGAAIFKLDQRTMAVANAIGSPPAAVAGILLYALSIRLAPTKQNSLFSFMNIVRLGSLAAPAIGLLIAKEKLLGEATDTNEILDYSKAITIGWLILQSGLTLLSLLLTKCLNELIKCIPQRRAAAQRAIVERAQNNAINRDGLGDFAPLSDDASDSKQKSGFTMA